LPAVTRLAPSPTGALHLGNVRTFLINWAMARRGGWRIVLRIEDLDGPRIKAGAAEAIASTLAWLGIDWDEGPMRQSDDLTPYRAALERLAGMGLAYPSELSRTQVEAAASAPQEGSHEVRFGPELRPGWFRVGQAVDAARGAGQAWRMATPGGAGGAGGGVEFEDRFAGLQRADPAGTVGDFILWTKMGLPAYQLAVVVDDARQGVTEVVRGDDLLDSAGRQLLLYRALGLGPEPRYTHLPLVVGTDGKRLAKRHGDSRVETYRGAGVPAEAVVGLMAWWSGMLAGEGKRVMMDAGEFAARLMLDAVPRGPVVFTPEDDAWLRDQAR
jgi:glutamyl-tRNA synthetase